MNPGFDSERTHTQKQLTGKGPGWSTGEVFKFIVFDSDQNSDPNTE